MNKINFISVNSKFIHSSLAAVGIKKMYSVYSEKFGVDMPELTVTETTVNESFDSVVYSVMNGADVFAFSVYIWNTEYIERLCEYIRSAMPESTIILGGPEVSYGTAFPEPLYDYVVCSEGERAFFALICELNGFSVPQDWNYTADGKRRYADNISDLSEIEFAYDETNISEFDNRIIYYESSRGCPFSCAYCLSSVCGKVRELPVGRVFSDLDFFIRHNVPQVKFVDRTFNCNKKRAREIWKYIIEADCRTNFHFEIGADLLDDEDLELLSKCPDGRIQLEAGIQSLYDPALEECCRHTDIKKLFKNINALVEKGNINIHVDLIAGLPYENFDTFKNSFNETYHLNSHQLQLGFLKLLHGTPLNNMLVKHGYVFSNHAPYEIIKNSYLSFEDICELKRIEDVLERFYNSNRFRRTLKEAVKLFGTPYEMFLCFADEFKTQKLAFRPISTKALYDFLSVLFKNLGTDFDKLLLLDYYTSEKSDVVPTRLRYLAGGRERAVNLLKSRAIKDRKNMQVKFIENTAYIIDYTDRTPVDGSFKIRETIENADM